MPRRQTVIRIILPFLSSALLVALAFGSAFRAAFVHWDDPINVTENVHVHGFSATNLRWMFTDLEHALRYKPLSWLAWASIYEIAGLNPSAFHLINLILHALNGGLTFFLFRSVLKRNGADEHRCSQAAALGAMVWLVHPLRVEPVAWVTGLPYELSIFFLLGSLLIYVSPQLDTCGGSHTPGLTAAAVFFVLAILSYPLVLGAVFLFPLLDHFVVGRFPEGSWNLRSAATRKTWAEKSPMFAAAGLLVALAVFTRLYRNSTWIPAASLGEFGLMERTAQAGYILGYYLWRPFWPVGLSPVYTELLTINPWSPRFLLSALAVAGLTAWLLASKASRPGLWALWLAYVAVMIPILGLTEHPHYPSDRYGMVGGLVLAFALAVGLSVARRYFRPLMALTIFAIVVCVPLSRHQSGVWQNSQVLFTHIIRELGDDPYRFDIYPRLVSFLINESRLDEAWRASDEAIRARQSSPEIRVLRGTVLFRQGRMKEATAEYELALAVQPKSAPAQYGLGLIDGAEGRFSAAAARFRRTLECDPSFQPARRDLDILEKAIGQSGRQNPPPGASPKP